MFERYSERARRVLFFARYEVSVLGGSTIEPAHVLLGLLRESKGSIEHLLATRDIPLVELRHHIEQQATRSTQVPTSVEMAFAEATQRVLNVACEEADRLRQPQVGPEHLLLALLRESDSVATSALTARGMTLDAARDYLASGNATVLSEPDTDQVEVENPLAAIHIQRIMQFVRDLAQAEPNNAESQDLVERIDDELMMLTLLLK